MDSIIFDVDGTLWDSTDIVAKAWTEVIQQKTDLDMIITAEKLHGLFGQILPDIAKQIFTEETTERQLELINMCCDEEHRALLLTPPAPFPGMEETLAELSKKYKLYMVSNCEAGYIEVFLEATGFAPYFQGHLCPGDTGNAKASNILQIIREHNLKSPVYVGDTAGDYKATKEAQIPFVFASYGFGDVENPDYIIKKPTDLLELF